MRKKFKLIKIYPNSPDVGYITMNVDIVEWYEKYPEFWEEVVERDFKVMSYRDLDNQNIFIMSEHGHQSYKCARYSCSNFCIHSVKRLSDGVVFTKGDKIITSVSDSYCSIYGFRIENNKLGINHTHEYLLTNDPLYMGKSHLSLIQHAEKKVIMMTHDRYKLYEGDEYYTIYTDAPILKVKGPFPCASKSSDYVHCNVKYFVDKRKADHYLLLNVEVLSIEEVKSLYPVMTDIRESKLIDIVEKKLCK